MLSLSGAGALAKLGRLAGMASLYANPLTAWWQRLSIPSSGRRVDLRLRHGPTLRVATGSHDVRVINEIWRDRCYEESGYNPQPGWTVVDLGAHKGIYTARALYLCPDLTVRAFEPDPENFECLTHNVARDNDSRVDTRRAAVAVKAGSATLWRIEGHSGCNTLHATRVRPSETAHSVEVPLVTLADALQGLEHVDLLKIDIEGSEYDLLLNGDTTALERVDRIIMEADYTSDIDPTHQVADLDRRLIELGFTHTTYRTGSQAATSKAASAPKETAPGGRPEVVLVFARR